MAITNAQQARQLLRDGTNYNPSKIISVPKEFKARENSPNTKLAYITKDEEKLLKKLKPGTPHKGPEGIPNYDSFDIGGGYTSGRDIDDSTGQARGGGSTFSGNDQTKQQNLKNIATSNKRQEEKFKSEKFKEEKKANIKIIRDNIKKNKEDRRTRINKILSGGFGVNNPFGLSPKELEDLKALGFEDEEDITDLQQLILDQAYEKNDRFSGANLSNFQNKQMEEAGITTPLAFMLQKSGLAQKGMTKNREFFSDPNYTSLFGRDKKSVLEAGKYMFDGNPITEEQFAMLSPAEMEEVYKDYSSRRASGEIDAYGNIIPNNDGGGSQDPCKGPNPPAYCFIGQNADETQEDVITRNLAGLTPRIGGSMFDFTGMADGGLADMDREAFLLGGIAKGLKKAVRGVKKIAKSPLGKAALGFAALKFGGGLGGFKNKLFGLPGVDEFGGTMGLFGKLGLTKGFGGMMPTFKGGIALTSLLPLLVGKTEEEKDDILKEYYASQQLTPSTTKRQMGSEFDFYNYNLAEGGMPSKEPVAKKVMPLLDMDGMEKDYRADGGFVPIGRMEKADDVPARLSKNEFVFTADAVRNAGEGDVDKGAEVMYNMMKNLESGGEVSEESQGLDGAREMFQTSQRLGEVI